MTEEEAFIKTILESPNEAVHRLVYADWLLERDDPRAEYLRLQVALETAAADGEGMERRDRFWELQNELDREWIALMNRGRKKSSSAAGKKRRKAAERRAGFQGNVLRFLQRYGQRGGNDRCLDHEIQEAVNRMKAEELDRLMRDED